MSDNDLGIYSKCFNGANAHLALSEPESFALKDVTGRDWICYPVPQACVAKLELLSELVDVDQVDEKSGTTTDVRLLFCRNIREFASKLAESVSGS